MRLATYNVENLFSRAKAMNLGSWAEGRPVLQRFAALNELLGEAVYTDAAKPKMAQLMIELGLAKSDIGPFVELRRSRGDLLKRPKAGGLEITAAGRADWIGSLVLREAPVDETATRLTARVIADLQADVLAVVEADSRPALVDFNHALIKPLGRPFRHIMLIDGNDERGIDVGLMTGPDYPIGAMHSHVDDRTAKGEALFSRDCAQFHIATPSGQALVLLVNHLKSKGYGSQVTSNKRRLLQAQRVQAIYQGLRDQGIEHIAVVGDFNDTPDSAAVAPLLQGELRDAFTHPAFDNGGYPGTYGTCAKGSKIDYLLLSPALFAKVQAGGVWRQGLWPGVRPARWAAYPELTDPVHAASDHAAAWVDLAL